MAVEKFEI